MEAVVSQAFAIEEKPGNEKECHRIDEPVADHHYEHGHLHAPPAVYKALPHVEELGMRRHPVEDGYKHLQHA